MLNTLFVIAFAAFAVDAPKNPAGSPPAAPKAAAKPSASDNDKILYVLGYMIGRNLVPFNLETADFAKLNAGLRDSAQQKKPRHDLNTYVPQIEAFAQKRAAKKAGAEKAKSKSFLEKMAKEKDAKVSPTGLIYIPIKEGDGPSPSSTDSVKAHYEGKLIDGTKFDSSYDRGEPTDFGLGAGIIRCWTEGVPKMKVGGKARLICPSDIAYGDEGRPPLIKGGATLDFIIELVGINK